MKNPFKSLRKVINPLVVNPCSNEEKSRRDSLRKGPRVEKLGPDAVRHEPDAVRPQVVAELKKKQRLQVGHDALVGSGERPSVGAHVIRMLPETILPPKIICPAPLCLPAHRVDSALFQTVHRHHIGRSCVISAQPALRAIPEAKGCVNIDNVKLSLFFLNVSTNPPLKLYYTQPASP